LLIGTAASNVAGFQLPALGKSFVGIPRTSVVLDNISVQMLPKEEFGVGLLGSPELLWLPASDPQSIRALQERGGAGFLEVRLHDDWKTYEEPVKDLPLRGSIATVTGTIVRYVHADANGNVIYSATLAPPG